MRCAPRPDDGRQDHLLDVGLAGEVRAVGVTLGLVEALLEQRAEDDRPHRRPVLLTRQPERSDLLGCEVERRDVGVEAAVEIRRALVAPAGGHAGAVHLPEEAEQQVVGASLALDDVLDGLGEEVPRQQADVLGEHRHDGLQDEPLGRLALDTARDEPVEDG